MIKIKNAYKKSNLKILFIDIKLNSYYTFI